MNRRLLALAAILAALSGCAKATRTDARPDCTCAGEPIVDPGLLAFLSKARSAHHEADLAEDQGDRARAITALDGLVRGPRPPSALRAPEAAEVIGDTLARLADLRSQTGDFPEALRDIDQGLELAANPTHFRGHLFEIQGVVLERRARALKDAGDAAGAAQMKAKAVDAFETAIKIQDQVIDEALTGKDGGRRAPGGG